LKLFQNIDNDFSIPKSNKVDYADPVFWINGKLLVQQLQGQVRYTYVKRILNPVIQLNETNEFSFYRICSFIFMPEK
jgi:hypothetical protein